MQPLGGQVYPNERIRQECRQQSDLDPSEEDCKREAPPHEVPVLQQNDQQGEPTQNHHRAVQPGEQI